MLIEFFIPRSPQRPWTPATLAWCPGHAKSNLEEGLIREFVPLENAFERPQIEKWYQLAYRAVISRAILAPSYKISADDKIGRGRTGAVALLKRAVAAIKACDHLIAPFPGGRFGFDQRLRLISPLLGFIRTAYGAQKMQRAENFGKPLQVAVIRCGCVLRRGLSLRRRLTGRGDWPGLRLGLRLRCKKPELLLGLKLRLRARLRWRQAENLCAGGSGAETARAKQ